LKASTFSTAPEGRCAVLLSPTSPKFVYKLNWNQTNKLEGIDEYFYLLEVDSGEIIRTSFVVIKVLDSETFLLRNPSPSHQPPAPAAQQSQAKKRGQDRQDGVGCKRASKMLVESIIF
jgi:hypothetical protein